MKVQKATIRPASAGDVNDISALIQRSVRILNAKDYAPHIIDLICRNFTSAEVLAKMQERDVFLSAMGGGAVGTVSLGGNRLHSLFVEPDLTGRGIGTELVSYLEGYARSKGLDEIELSSSVTARQFYLSRGYAEIAFEERPDGSTYLMRKTLA